MCSLCANVADMYRVLNILCVDLSCPPPSLSLPFFGRKIPWASCSGDWNQRGLCGLFVYSPTSSVSLRFLLLFFWIFSTMNFILFLVSKYIICPIFIVTDDLITQWIHEIARYFDISLYDLSWFSIDFESDRYYQREEGEGRGPNDWLTDCTPIHSIPIYGIKTLAGPLHNNFSSHSSICRGDLWMFSLSLSLFLLSGGSTTVWLRATAYRVLAVKTVSTSIYLLSNFGWFRIANRQNPCWSACSSRLPPHHDGSDCVNVISFSFSALFCFLVLLKWSPLFCPISVHLNLWYFLLIYHIYRPFCDSFIRWVQWIMPYVFDVCWAPSFIDQSCRSTDPLERFTMYGLIVEFSPPLFSVARVVCPLPHKLSGTLFVVLLIRRELLFCDLSLQNILILFLSFRYEPGLTVSCFNGTQGRS